MNVMRLFIALAAIILLPGCVTVEKVVREKVDQDVSGNRGYLQGSGPAKSTAGKDTTREFIDVRVEIPTWDEMRQTKQETKKPAQTTKSEYSRETESYSSRQAEEFEEPQAEEIEETISETPQQPTTYTVKEGDTLGHISQKVYGKALKWTMIYEANMDKIKDPEKLKPGMVLVIPPLEKESQSKDVK
ncbi:MAG: LysM peptidoglycan-binding domain-containing protein [Candidatus Omnitrophota bacterium]